MAPRAETRPTASASSAIGLVSPDPLSSSASSSRSSASVSAHTTSFLSSPSSGSSQTLVPTSSTSNGTVVAAAAPSSGSGAPIGAIVGAVVGVVALIAIGAILFWCLRRRKKARHQTTPSATAQQDKSDNPYIAMASPVTGCSPDVPVTPASRWADASVRHVCRRSALIVCRGDVEYGANVHGRPIEVDGGGTRPYYSIGMGKRLQEAPCGCPFSCYCVLRPPRLAHGPNEHHMCACDRHAQRNCARGGRREGAASSSVR